MSFDVDTMTAPGQVPGVGGKATESRACVAGSRGGESGGH